MFKDAYTGEPFKGVGVTDYAGNKINSNYVVPVEGLPKGQVFSKYDPKVKEDSLRPNVYIYVGSSVTTNMTVVIMGKTYSFGYTGIPVKDLVPVIDDQGMTCFVPDYKTALSIPGVVEVIKAGLLCSKRVAGNFSAAHYERFSHPKFDKNSYKEGMKYGYLTPTYLLSEGKHYTFGVEIETCSGIVPLYIRKDLNIDCQYDGSIVDARGNKDVGGEYTTGVLRGDNGFAHLYKIMGELDKRCDINASCSIHVHVGGLTFNKEHIVLLYKVFQDIEAEMFAMMPPSRSVREHCRKMQKLDINLKKRGVPYDVLIDTYYRRIFELISLGRKPSNKVNKSFNHPNGRYCGYDRSTPRYWWVNFVPAMFNIKGSENYTIEIRNHSATLDYIKAKNWILICLGIVSYVENHKQELLKLKKVSIRDIIRATYPGKKDYLLDYIQQRTDLFREEVGKANEVKEYTHNGKYSEMYSIKQIFET